MSVFNLKDPRLQNYLRTCLSCPPSPILPHTNPRRLTAPPWPLPCSCGGARRPERKRTLSSPPPLQPAVNLQPGRHALAQMKKYVQTNTLDWKP